MFAAATLCHIHQYTTLLTQRFKPQAMLLRRSDWIEVLSKQIASAEKRQALTRCRMSRPWDRRQ
jgi:hypothetical protein